MKTFFEFWQMMSEENQGGSETERLPGGVSQTELEKQWKRISQMKKAKPGSKEPKEFTAKREKGFDPNRLDPGLRDLVNDEVNHRVHEFAKIVANLSSAEKITSWVGRHNTKLPYNMEIAGDKVVITPEMLKKESEDYLSIGDKFMGPASDKGTLDFASLLFGKMGRDQEAFADILGTGDREFSKMLRTIGKQDFSYTSFHPNLKDKAVDFPLANAFDTGALDKAIIMTIYLRNRGKDESSSERRWRGAFKWISKNVFAKIRAKQKKSLDTEMGDTGKTAASQIPDLRTSAGGTTKFNRAMQIGALIMELKRMIEHELPSILSSSGAQFISMIGADIVSRNKLRAKDIAFRGICANLSSAGERAELPKFGGEDKYKELSGTKFVVGLFDEIATQMINLDQSLIQSMFKDPLLTIVKGKMMGKINERLRAMGEEEYAPSSIQNLAKLFIILLDKAEENMAKQAQIEHPGERWGFIKQRLEKLPIKPMSDLTARAAASSPSEKFKKYWRERGGSK